MPLYTRAGYPPVIPTPPKRISDEDAIILKLTKENESLKKELKSLNDAFSSVRSLLDRAGIPSYFEDGNDGDDLSTSERLILLEAKLNRLNLLK